MTDATACALNHVRSLARGAGVPRTLRVTLNFHPDAKAGGIQAIAGMAADGFYKSQFETGASNGAVSAYPGGARWEWEDRMF